LSRLAKKAGLSKFLNINGKVELADLKLLRQRILLVTISRRIGRIDWEILSFIWDQANGRRDVDGSSRQ